MNYKLHYDKLIQKARNRSILKSEYKEVHHIVPTCIGGPDTKENKVALFVEEHLTAHLLLTKIYPDSYGLSKAAHCMTTGFNYGTRNLNKEYKWVREEYSKKQSEWFKENHYLSKMSDTEREEFLDKNVRGENNPNYGNTWNDEQRARASEFHIRNKTWEGANNFHYGKKGELSPHFGVPKSKAHRAKMSLNVIGNKNPNWGQKGKLAKEAKHYIMVNPAGEEFELFGTMQTTITDFCIEHNLNFGRIKNSKNKGVIGETYKSYKNKIDVVSCEGWEFRSVD